MNRVFGVFLSKRYFQRHDFFFDILVMVAVANICNTMPPNDFKLTTKICIDLDKNSLKARHKSCFLRPDTGPCRADIIQFYYDAMEEKCYRFFWGGCQGNGNRFETKQECVNYCVIDSKKPEFHIPHFCSLAFDFGTCFGHYNRWTWDNYAKTCKRRLYSGCGGNQNNFETQNECMSTCLNAPNNTFNNAHKYTTCIPFTISELQ